MAEITLGEVENGKSVVASVGDVIVVCLPENPTTGYQWTFGEMHKGLLALQDTTFSPGAAIGSGGPKIFRLQVKQKGVVHVELKLWREWEGDASITRRFGFTIEARNG